MKFAEAGCGFGRIWAGARIIGPCDDDQFCPGRAARSGLIGAAELAAMANCWGQACGDVTGEATTGFAAFGRSGGSAR